MFSIDAELLPVALAVAAGYAFGAVWYTALSRQWQAAAGLSEADMRGENSRTPPWFPFVVAFLCQIAIALVLASLLKALGGQGVGAFGGLLTGTLVWLGFVVPTTFTNYQFQGAPITLTLIDGGHWLGVLLIQGVILGAFLA
ncbi:MAG: DUF1761 domain-containing protein [Hyphomicrobiaceae bacterium]